jgi:hypothetical protein
MASTKRSALAPGCIIDTAALHQYNTTNFVEYASLELPATSCKLQAKASSNEQQAASDKQRGSSDKPRAASSSISEPS